MMVREGATVMLQIVLVLAALGALFYFVRSGQNVGVRASKRLAFAGFVLLNIYAVLRPNDVTWVARHLGIGRGTDLVVYLLVVAFVFGMLNTYLRDREISQHLTNLARQLAIRDAELARREDELAERLRAVSGLAAGEPETNGGSASTGRSGERNGAVPADDTTGRAETGDVSAEVR
jgi:small membrane protein